MKSFARAIAATFLLCGTLFCQSPQSPDPWAGVSQALGKAGKLQDGVYKVSFPRSDLNVHIGSTKVLAGAGLGSWVALRQEGSASIADGDLVLLSSEVAPVMAGLQNAGFEITALHNHLLGEEPQVMYMHFFRHGDGVETARALRTALEQTKTPMGPAPQPSGSLPEQKAIEQILGKAGTASGTVVAFSFARSHEISMHRNVLPPTMGMATSINFQPASKGVAATGDFVVREKEVQPVIASLRQGGATVSAIHNHLLDDEPRMVFIHFWIEGAADKVATAMKSTLAATEQK
jgi:hypothetical protein